MEQIWNGYGTDKEREWEHVWNSNRMRSVKRSLLGFFQTDRYSNLGCQHDIISCALQILGCRQ